MIRIKKGVKLAGLQPEMILAAVIADQVFTKYGVEYTVITEGTGGKHGFASLHYVGFAIDVRRIENMQQIVDEIRENLGENYDVVLEDDHLHIEFQPK